MYSRCEAESCSEASFSYTTQTARSFVWCWGGDRARKPVSHDIVPARGELQVEIVLVEVDRPALLPQWPIPEVDRSSVSAWWLSRVGYRLDLYDSGAKPILLKQFRFLNGARTDTFFKIKSKTIYIYTR